MDRALPLSLPDPTGRLGSGLRRAAPSGACGDRRLIAHASRGTIASLGCIRVSGRDLPSRTRQLTRSAADGRTCTENAIVGARTTPRRAVLRTDRDRRSPSPCWPARSPRPPWPHPTPTPPLPPHCSPPPAPPTTRAAPPPCGNSSTPRPRATSTPRRPWTTPPSGNNNSPHTWSPWRPNWPPRPRPSPNWPAWRTGPVGWARSRRYWPATHRTASSTAPRRWARSPPTRTASSGT